MLIKAVSAAITAANTSLSVTEINGPRSSSRSRSARVPARLANPDQVISPQNPSPPPLPTSQRWTRGLKFNLKIALNYLCCDHLLELLVWLSGKGL